MSGEVRIIRIEHILKEMIEFLLKLIEEIYYEIKKKRNKKSKK